MGARLPWFLSPALGVVEGAHSHPFAPGRTPFCFSSPQILVINFFTGSSAPAASGRVNAQQSLDSPKVVNKMEVSKKKTKKTPFREGETENARAREREARRSNHALRTHVVAAGAPCVEHRRKRERKRKRGKRKRGT